MDSSVDTAAREQLLAMYANLRSVYVSKQGKPPMGSVLFGLLNMKSNNRRSDLLRLAAVPSTSFRESAAQLVDAGLVDFVNANGDVALTSRGIWCAETTSRCIEPDDLIEFIETKWFGCFADLKTPLTDKEKIVLLVMLAARAFSLDAGVNLKREGAHETWQSCVQAAAQFLRDGDFVGDAVMPEVLELSEKRTSLRPLEHFFRYTENIKRKTDGMYQAKSLVYYLKLDVEDGIDRARLGYLFSLVFGEDVDLELASRITEFCRLQANEVAVGAYGPDETHYATYEYDGVIERALRDLALGG